MARTWKARSTKNGMVFGLVASGRGWTNRQYFKAVDGRGELKVQAADEQKEWLKEYGAVQVRIEELDVRVQECRRDGTVIVQPFGSKDKELKDLYGVLLDGGARAIGVE